MPQTQVAYHPLQGGLDLVSPVLNVQPGFLLDGINYEPDINGGYRRIPGYERYDGQPSPSDREHQVLQLDRANVFTTGDVLTGQRSQASGTVVLVDERLVCLCSVTGEFQLETVTNQGETAVITSLDYTQDAMTAYTQQERWQAMEDYYRALIGKPPGTGKVEGVCHYKGTTFAFRRNNDSVTISKSSPTGWNALPQADYLRFQGGGQRTPVEGDTFTTPNDATATIQRVIRQGGSNDDLSVYGYFMLDNIVGTINNNDRLELGSHSAGQVHSAGYITMTIEGIDLTATLPAVGEQVKNQASSPATGEVHEAILRQEGDSPETIKGWFLLSGVSGSFADGDRITRENDSEPFGNVKGKPLPAIRSKNHGDTPAEIGDIVEFGTSDNDPEGRVYWTHTYSDEDGDRLYLVLQNLVNGNPSVNDSIYVIQIAGYANGRPQPIELVPGGVFEFRTWNFFARTEQERIYGCNGQGPAFELNPNTGLICPILMEDPGQENNPHAIEVHKNHLFLGLPGGLVRHSVIGEPMNFNGQLGAFEVGTGDEVTALVSHPGDVLAIICRNRIQGLYGQTIDNWQMDLIAENAGGYPRTVQLLQQAYMLDDNGLIELQRVMAYGNFEQSAISRLVQPLINQYKTSVVGSAVLRDHNLICLYGRQGQGVTFKPNPGAVPEILNFDYQAPISCVHYAEDNTGSARVFLGSDTGWVFEARRGSNFDGQPIEAVIRTAYNHLKSPTYRKSFKRLELMLSGGYDVFLQVGMELDYSAAYTPQPVIRNFTLFGGQGGYWNEDNWNEFFWSGQDVSTGEVSVSGTGKNYSLMIYSKSAWTDPYTLQGFLVHYIMRRLDRG